MPVMLSNFAEDFVPTPVARFLKVAIAFKIFSHRIQVLLVEIKTGVRVLRHPVSREEPTSKGSANEDVTLCLKRAERLRIGKAWLELFVDVVEVAKYLLKTEACLFACASEG
jgi:hypothetical protein